MAMIARNSAWQVSMNSNRWKWNINSTFMTSEVENHGGAAADGGVIPLLNIWEPLYAFSH